jgi:ABC-type transport system involved in multi-copper enzyme maturation permease subunit
MTALAVFHVRTILRGRSAVVAVVGFALAAGIITVLGLSSFRQLGFGAVGPAAVGFLNLALLLPTAQAMLVGSLAVSATRESGLLAMVRARGVSPLVLLAAVWLSVTLAAGIALVAGFGVAALILTGNVPMSELPRFAAVLLVALGVAAAASGIGALVGAVAGSRLQAALVALVAWFVLAIGLDLLVVGFGVFLRAGEAALLASIALNPIQAGRILGLLVIDPSGATLGTLGTYLVGRLGAGGAGILLGLALAAWSAATILVAGWWLRRRDP